MPDTRAEFQASHDTFRPEIVRYLSGLVGPSEAEILAQIVMLKVSEGLSGFRGDSELSTWIYRIATNCALDRLRSPAFHRASNTISPEALDGDSDYDYEDLTRPPERQSPSVEATAIREEMSTCIRDFVERLPPSYRTVIVSSESITARSPTVLRSEMGRRQLASRAFRARF